MDKNAEARKLFIENSSLLSFYVFSFSCFSTAARKQIVDLHRSKPLISLVLGQIFFLLFFVFSLTCYRVFIFFSLSGISLITLLCYVLYVNFVIVCYLALFLPVYVSISVTALVEVDFFSSVAPTTNPVILSIWYPASFSSFFINFILQSP